MQKRYETTSLKNPQEEKKLLHEIKQLKATLPVAEELLKIKPEIDALYTERKEVRAKLDNFTAQIEALDEEINKFKKEMEDAKEQRQDIKQQLDKFEEDIQKVRADLDKLFDRKDETREEYFKAKLDYEIQKDQIAHAEWIKRQKEQLAEREKLKAERIEAKKQALLDRPNPYQKEIDTCEHLIGYCNKLKVQTGMVQVPVEEQIKEEQKQIMSQLNKEDVNKKLQDGKLERVLSKREREEQSLMQVGGKKKGKAPKKVKAADMEEAFKIDILAINKFGFLKVSPPLDKESLDTKIQELTDKMAKYQVEGEQRLKEEEEKLLNAVD